MHSPLLALCDSVLLGLFQDIGVVGLDLWQVKSGSIFDNILITDDISEAEDRADQFKALAAGEEKAKKAGEDAERAAREAEDKAKEAQSETPEEDQEDDEDDGEEVVPKDEL